jgi:hypothetical protein
MKNLAPHLAPETRVEWKREVYRMPYAQRPIDTGKVVENDGEGFVKVLDDRTGQVVTGPWVVFTVIA